MKRWMSAGLLAVPCLFLSVTARADDAALSQKIDRVLEKQDQILAELASVKEELQIVKVRATR